MDCYTDYRLCFTGPDKISDFVNERGKGMNWDHTYRQLEKGEFIKATDEYLETDHPWHGGNDWWRQAPPHMKGRKASDPNCPAHTIYRRKINAD